MGLIIDGGSARVPSDLIWICGDKFILKNCKLFNKTRTFWFVNELSTLSLGRAIQIRDETVDYTCFFYHNLF